MSRKIKNSVPKLIINKKFQNASLYLVSTSPHNTGLKTNSDDSLQTRYLISSNNIGGFKLQFTVKIRHQNP